MIDSKQYSGRLHLAADGSLWHGRYPLAPALRAVRFEADQAAQVLAAPRVQVVPVVAVHGAPVPFGKLVADSVTVVPARRVSELLRTCRPNLKPEHVAWLADRAQLRFRAVA